MQMIRTGAACGSFFASKKSPPPSAGESTAVYQFMLIAIRPSFNLTRSLYSGFAM